MCQSGIYVIEVGIAHHYPPTIHEFVKVMVQADNPCEAELIANQIAATRAGCMPVCSVVIDWPE